MKQKKKKEMKKNKSCSACAYYFKTESPYCFYFAYSLKRN